jgi:adenylosuccinate lyase
MKEQCKGHADLAHAAEFIHFACTSEDANNVAQATPNFRAESLFTSSQSKQALMISGARAEVIMPRISSIIQALQELSIRHASQPMMARTSHMSTIFTTETLVLFWSGRHTRATRHSHNSWQRNVSFCSQAAASCISLQGADTYYRVQFRSICFIQINPQAVSIRAKMNGATGNFSAHTAAAPHVDWRGLSRSVIEGAGCACACPVTCRFRFN